MHLQRMLALTCAASLPLFVGCARAENDRQKSATVAHVFSWNDADGYGKDAAYKWDGKEIGKGNTALATLKKADIGHGDIIEIRFPAGSKIRDRDYYSPYEGSGLINAWLKRSVKLSVYLGDKKLTSMTVTWKGYPEGDAKIEETEFFANGMSVGKGERAFKMLRELEGIDEDTYIQVVHPSVVYPKGDAHLLKTPFRNEDFIYTWKGKGAIVHLFQERHL